MREIRRLLWETLKKGGHKAVNNRFHAGKKAVNINITHLRGYDNASRSSGAEQSDRPNLSSSETNRMP